MRWRWRRLLTAVSHVDIDEQRDAFRARGVSFDGADDALTAVVDGDRLAGIRDPGQRDQHAVDAPGKPVDHADVLDGQVGVPLAAEQLTAPVTLAAGCGHAAGGARRAYVGDAR